MKAFPTAASSPLRFPFPREGRFRSPSSIHPAILLRRRLVRILPGASLSRAHTRAQTSGFRVQRGDSQYACDSHGPSCSARHLHRIRSEQPERCAGEQRAICKPHGSPRPSCCRSIRQTLLDLFVRKHFSLRRIYDVLNTITNLAALPYLPALPQKMLTTIVHAFTCRGPVALSCSRLLILYPHYMEQTRCAPSTISSSLRA